MISQSDVRLATQDAPQLGGADATSQTPLPGSEQAPAQTAVVINDHAGPGLLSVRGLEREYTQPSASLRLGHTNDLSGSFFVIEPAHACTGYYWRSARCAWVGQAR